MTKITAKGKTATGADCVIVVEEKDGVIIGYINGKKDDTLLQFLDEVACTAEPVGGTYYLKGGTMLDYCIVLESNFFKQLYSIVVDGDIGTIPYEEGVIY